MNDEVRAMEQFSQRRQEMKNPAETNDPTGLHDITRIHKSDVAAI